MRLGFKKKNKLHDSFLQKKFLILGKKKIDCMTIPSDNYFSIQNSKKFGPFQNFLKKNCVHRKKARDLIYYAKVQDNLFFCLSDPHTNVGCVVLTVA